MNFLVLVVLMAILTGCIDGGDESRNDTEMDSWSDADADADIKCSLETAFLSSIEKRYGNEDTTVTCNRESRSAAEDPIIASGNLIELSFPIEGFSKIGVDCYFAVEVQQGSEYKIVITIDDNLQDYVDVRKEGEWLYIDVNDGMYFNVKGVTMIAKVMLPMLSEISASGVSAVYVNRFDVPDAEVALQAFGTAALWACADVKSLDATVKGATQTFIEGNTDRLSVHAEGNARFDSTALVAQNASVALKGASETELAFSKNVTGELHESAYFCYENQSGVIDLYIDSIAAVWEECPSWE